MITATVKVDLKPLIQFRKNVDQDLRSGGQQSGGSPIANAIKQWAVRYRAYIQERFYNYSLGGGDWPPLKISTIRARRGRKVKRGRSKIGLSAAILRDTGTLFNALSPEFVNKPGAIQEDIPFGVRVGYGGPGTYTKKHKGNATIADIANFHQIGAGHLPIREIIVPPSEHVIELMQQDMERALTKMRE